MIVTVSMIGSGDSDGDNGYENELVLVVTVMWLIGLRC